MYAIASLVHINYDVIQNHTVLLNHHMFEHSQSHAARPIGMASIYTDHDIFKQQGVTSHVQLHMTVMSLSHGYR